MHVLVVIGQVLVGPTILSLAANFVFGASEHLCGDSFTQKGVWLATLS